MAQLFVCFPTGQDDDIFSTSVTISPTNAQKDQTVTFTCDFTLIDG